MLKRHQCTLDLKNNLLVIGSTGTQTPFLSEAELPECARLSSQMANEDEAMSKSASEFEDRQLAEAMKASAAEAKRLKGSEAGAGSSTSGGAASTSTSKDPKTTVMPDDKFTEENVTALMKYGFPREKCIEELRDKNGDVTQATAALFAKSLKF